MCVSTRPLASRSMLTDSKIVSSSSSSGGWYTSLYRWCVKCVVECWNNNNRNFVGFSTAMEETPLSEWWWDDNEPAYYLTKGYEFDHDDDSTVSVTSLEDPLIGRTILVVRQPCKTKVFSSQQRPPTPHKMGMSPVQVQHCAYVNNDYEDNNHHKTTHLENVPPTPLSTSTVWCDATPPQDSKVHRPLPYLPTHLGHSKRSTVIKLHPRPSSSHTLLLPTLQKSPTGSVTKPTATCVSTMKAIPEEQANNLKRSCSTVLSSNYTTSHLGCKRRPLFKEPDANAMMMKMAATTTTTTTFSMNHPLLLPERL